MAGQQCSYSGGSRANFCSKQQQQRRDSLAANPLEVGIAWSCQWLQALVSPLQAVESCSASCPACCRGPKPGCASWLPFQEVCCAQHKVHLLQPCRVAKADGSELGTADLRVGTPVPLYGRMFHIVGCDAFTRTFLEEQGVTMPDDLEWPSEPREVVKQVGRPTGWLSPAGAAL